MYYVYILKLNTKKIYIGYANDLKRRVGEHTNGKCTYTRNKRPLELIYYEAYKAKSDATKREHHLKEYKSSWGQLKKRIAESSEDLKSGGPR